jgi:hypothetical protein
VVFIIPFGGATRVNVPYMVPWSQLVYFIWVQPHGIRKVLLLIWYAWAGIRSPEIVIRCVAEAALSCFFVFIIHLVRVYYSLLWLTSCCVTAPSRLYEAQYVKMGVTLGRAGLRLQRNMKVNRKEICMKNVEQILLTQDSNRWWDFGNTA